MAKEISLRVGSSFPVAVSEAVGDLGLMSDPARNLAEAQKHGLRPVNFHQLMSQFSVDTLRNAVLFDSSPQSAFPGNHWRIVGIDNLDEGLLIQLCGGPYGNHDVRDIPLFTVSQYDILFTGMNVLQYSRNGYPLSLNQVNELISADQGDIILEKETQYWANEVGLFVPASSVS